MSAWTRAAFIILTNVKGDSCENKVDPLDVDQFVEGVEGAADHAVLPDLGGCRRARCATAIVILVNVQTDVVDFAHGCLFSLSVY